jgi:hypothetical protein
MSIAFWKTILGLAKILSVVIILAAAFLFWQHRQRMAVPMDPPNFAPEVRIGRERGAAPTGALSIALGRFQRLGGPAPEAAKPEVVQDFTTELAKLCEITDAIVVWGEHAEGDAVSAIVVRWKQRPPSEQGETKTIRLGEALIDRPHPRAQAERLPYRYKFVGCEPDAEHPGWTYFLFDVNCDGSDIQKARWHRDEVTKDLPAPSAEPPGTGGPVSTKDIYIGPPLGAGEPEPPAPTPGPVVEATPVPAPPPPPPPAETPDTLFEEEGGTWATTAEGAEYLARNYERLVEETRTSTYRDRDGRAMGIRIVGIKSTSVANQFDIRKDDVILTINGVPVTTQSEAVKVVKDRLARKETIITVELLRRGNKIVRRFDSRDPATRRAAQKFR